MNSALAWCGTLLVSLMVFTVELPAEVPQVKDIGLGSKFQDTFGGHHKRGRASIAADYNLDGLIDFFIGNPGDESFILVNSSQTGKAAFKVQQILLEGELAWGGVAFDHDNDGDYDLLITCGANEGIAFDYLFRNDWILDGEVTGTLNFTDVTAQAGVAGPIPADSSEPIMTASAHAVTADYDQDGDTDLFINGNILNSSIPDFPDLIGRNTLYRNNGDGTFTDVTVQAGLAASLQRTRHSTFLDFDNDGDPDLYENNLHAENILWANNGDGTFTDVTDSMSLPGHNLHFPSKSFASAAADFNNDGREDLIVYMTGGEEVDSPYEMGHAIFMNRVDGFENLAALTRINEIYFDDLGVMGCQVGDLNGDGTPDVYVGNGGPPSGTVDQLYLSTPGRVDPPVYRDVTALIDVEPEIPAGLPVPPYPYRTHGTSFVDTDGDGSLEIAVVNGGPAASSDEVREPNRLFKLLPDEPYGFFRLRVVGDGSTVSLDAIGTRARVLVSDTAGNQWAVHRTLFAGSAFSAQNGFNLHFGINGAASVDELRIIWPNGDKSTIIDGLAVDSTFTFFYGEEARQTDSSAAIGADALVDRFAVHVNYPNPFNPGTWIRYTIPQTARVQVQIFDVTGARIWESMESGLQAAGMHEIRWNGRDVAGNPVSSGVYIYQVRAGDLVQSRKMLLVK